MESFPRTLCTKATNINVALEDGKMWCVLPRPDAMQLHISRQRVSMGLLTLTGFFQIDFPCLKPGEILEKLERQDTSSAYLIDTQGLGP